MLFTVFEISISMSVIILAILLLTPIIDKRYSAKWRYLIWLFIALRLVVPFNFTLPKAPINIEAPAKNVVIDTENKNIKISDSPLQTNNSNLTYSNKNSDTFLESETTIAVIDVITYIWIFGMVVFILYNFLNYWIFRFKISKISKITKPNNMEKAFKELKIRKTISVVSCDKVLSPMLVGFIKPMIILPDTNYSDKEIEVILKHELTHYKRHDLWYKLLLIVANSIHWFNPIIYFMVRQANRDLEYSCDDTVVKDGDMEYRKDYSRTILKSMEESRNYLF